MAQHSRSQPGQPLEAAGTAGRDRRLVADQPAAEAGKDRWAIGEARAVLLADAGGRTPDARAVRSAAADRDVAASGKLTAGGNARKSNR